MMWGYFNSHPHIIPNISDFLLRVTPYFIKNCCAIFIGKQYIAIFNLITFCRDYKVLLKIGS